MEKKTLPYRNILATGLFNAVHGGSQPLFHTPQQKKDLAAGKFLLRSQADFTRLFTHQSLRLN